MFFWFLILLTTFIPNFTLYKTVSPTTFFLQVWRAADASRYNISKPDRIHVVFQLFYYSQTNF